MKKMDSNTNFAEIQTVIKSIRANKILLVTNTENDANILNTLLEENNMYWATTDTIISELPYIDTCKMYIFQYKTEEKNIQDLKNIVYESCKIFKIINLTQLNNFNTDKDINNWLNNGHTIEELIQFFNRSLDLKNKDLLQQNAFGIYKYVQKKDAETKKIYITNFTILKSSRIILVDKQQEGIKLILKSSSGEIFERTGEVSVFHDVKTFKNFLGSMDITFKGGLQDLTNLKIWINNYFTFNIEEIHDGIKFINKNNTLMLVTNNGAICSNGIDTTIKSVAGVNININDIEFITPLNMKELFEHLLNFTSKEKALCILGTVINNLCIVQSKNLKIKGHHLLIVGESGSGKSTILKSIIAAILNYPDEEIKSIGLITNFALIKTISQGNYPVLFDEYKPTLLDKYKNEKLSEIFRNSYDRATVSRGNKNLDNRNFVLNRPIILAGEESYKNSETALMERSCIVYLSKQERTKEQEFSMNWLQKNEILLNKLGVSLINTILNLNVCEYNHLRETLKQNFISLKDRVLNTAINIATGIEVLNILLKNLGLNEIKNYTDLITKNIKLEILEERENSLSQVEQMLILYNQLIEDARAENVNEVIKIKDSNIYIKTSEMINQISEFNKKIGADIIILKLKDFKKQAKKSNYIMDTKYLHFDTDCGRKTIRYDLYDSKKLQKLNLNSIAPKDVLEIVDLNDTMPF